MAHLWIQRSGDGVLNWAMVPLAGQAYRLMSAEPYVRRADAASDCLEGELLTRIMRETTEDWLLLTPPGARLWVNGQEEFLGVCVLADRDEIRLQHGQRLYFSTERLTQVTSFPGSDHEALCGRCRQPIRKGTPAVLCPNCGAWSHQTEELPCWRYEGSSHCPLCDQSNAVEVDFRWSPIGV